MWSAHPLGWLSSRYRVDDGGREIATLSFGAWRQLGTIDLDGRSLVIHREGFWHPKFLLKEGAAPQVFGQAAGAFRSGFSLARGDQEYRLDRSAWFRNDYALTQRGRFLGSIRACGVFSRAYSLEIEDEVPVEVRLFGLWLILVAARRAAAATVTS